MNFIGTHTACTHVYTKIAPPQPGAPSLLSPAPLLCMHSSLSSSRFSVVSASIWTFNASPPIGEARRVCEFGEMRVGGGLVSATWFFSREQSSVGKYWLTRSP